MHLRPKEALKWKERRLKLFGEGHDRRKRQLLL